MTVVAVFSRLQAQALKLHSFVQRIIRRSCAALPPEVSFRRVRRGRFAKLELR
jgi:hypothetical protein